LKPARANNSARPYLEKSFTKIGLVDWLVKILSSSPTKKKEKKVKAGKYKGQQAEAQVQAGS
jgi:hypothetical protein